MAVLVTVASLFASAWPGPPRQPATQRTASTTDDRGDILPALELVGADGRTVALRGHLPAVILLTEGCECDQLIADAVAAVRPEIAVITIVGGRRRGRRSRRHRRPAPPRRRRARPCASCTTPPASCAASSASAEPDGTAAVLLVDRGGEIIRKVPRTASIERDPPDLARL